MRRIVLLSFVAFACSLGTKAQTVSTFAGTGVAGYNGDSMAATSAKLYGPYGVALDGAGNTYIIDQDNQRIRMVNSAGIITTIAGNGTAGFSGDSSLAIDAQLNSPTAIAAANGNIYIADMGNNRIRKINASGIITTIAGTGALGYNGDNIPATSAKLNGPTGVAVDKTGNVYIADRTNQRVRKVDTSGMITTVAGTGAAEYNGDTWPSATQASLWNPTAVTLDSKGNLYIADQWSNRIRKVDTFNKISTVAGNGFEGYCPDGLLATSMSLFEPNAVAVDSLGNIYISDEKNYRILRVNYNDNFAFRVAGTGVSGNNGDSGLAKNVDIGDCRGLAVDNGGNVYFADWSNNRVSRVSSTVYVSPLNENISGVNIYPNPNSGSFTVDIVSGSSESAHLTIVNVMGQTVKEINTDTNKQVLVNLDIVPGVYFIKAATANGSWSGKLEVSSR